MWWYKKDFLLKTMKKNILLIVLFVCVFLASCKNDEPEMIIRNSRLYMILGDVAEIEVKEARRIDYSYSSTRNETNHVFEYSTYMEKARIRALNPGIDTLFVWDQFSKGIATYANGEFVLVTVYDKQ